MALGVEDTDNEQKVEVEAPERRDSSAPKESTENVPIFFLARRSVAETLTGTFRNRRGERRATTSQRQPFSRNPCSNYVQTDHKRETTDYFFFSPRTLEIKNNPITPHSMVGE